MAEIAIVEKAPGYRLDHPDFGVVSRVTFAKGTIKKFKALQDDPIKVPPRATVIIDGDESEELPIFFRAKKDYWNTPDHQATDLDKDKMTYQNAWQSFRGDDEVKVMLVDGKPFAILGFLDGVPRVGEDIVKLETEDPSWFQMSKQEKYGDGNKGPDGLDLGLKLEAELIKDEHFGTGDWSTVATLHSFAETSLREEYSEESHDGGPVGCKGTNYYTWFYCDGMYGSTEWQTRSASRHQIHLVKVGAILYLFHSRWWETEGREHSSSYFAEGGCFAFCVAQDVSCYPGWTWAHFDNCPSVYPGAAAECAAGSFDWTNPNPPDMEPSGSAQLHLTIYAAPYSKELYEALKENPPAITDEWYLSPDPPTGTIEQVEFNQKIYNEYYDLHVDISKGMKYKIRPHTKDELKKADLWPI